MTSVLVDERPKSAAAAHLATETANDGLTIGKLVAGLASLKFTVTLFAMTIVLVFAGTLAQVDKDIWQVIDEYFRTSITWIDLQLFFPRSFFPNQPRVPGGFYFPGGWLLGALLMVNLLAAHAVRFKVQARGRTLVVGSAAILAGVLLTTWIIVAGSGYDGLLASDWLSWAGVWRGIQVALGAGSGMMLYGAWRLERGRTLERRLLVAGAVVLMIGLAWTLYRGEAGRLDDSSLRILWQLGKGTLAGLVLLAGCALVFRKRAISSAARPALSPLARPVDHRGRHSLDLGRRLLHDFAQWRWPRHRSSNACRKPFDALDVVWWLGDCRRNRRPVVAVTTAREPTRPVERTGLSCEACPPEASRIGIGANLIHDPAIPSTSDAKPDENSRWPNRAARDRSENCRW